MSNYGNRNMAGSKIVGLKKEDAKNRARWGVGVGEIAGRVG